MIMLSYKGTYDSGSSYNIGDIVVFTDGLAYFKTNEAPVGTSCHDVRYWNCLQPPLSDAVLAIHGMILSLNDTLSVFGEAISSLENVVVDSKTLVLGSSTEDSDKKFAITVDDDGDVSATEIEEESAGDGET